MLPMQLIPAVGLLLQAAAPLAHAKPIVVEALKRAPQDWIDIKPAEPDHLVKLSIVLNPQDDQLLEDTLHAVSDPTSERYGKHLTRDEAKALLQPRPESSDAVRRWLAEAGVPDHHVRDDGQVLHAHVPVKKAEGLLETRFRVFARGDEHLVRTLEYSVPVQIRSHITTIQPTTFFGSTTLQGNTVYPKFPIRKRAASGMANRSRKLSGKGEHTGRADLEDCKDTITPACLRELYRMPDGAATPNNRSLLGVAGFGGQAAQYRELDQFIDRWATYARGANFSVESINDGENPQGEYSSGEANLNIQYAIAVAYDLPVRFYTTGGEYRDYIPDLDINDPAVAAVEPYLEFANYLVNLADDELPPVMSISYGINEQVLPRAYATQVCNMFGQLGTRGMSILVAAGNTGPGPSCMSNDGTNTTKFLPIFPASCPYVTAVGGTVSNSPEVAYNLSSGGFSEYFSRPRWQDAAVGRYLAQHGDEWEGYYNSSGRGFPDVAAQARHYQIMNHNEVEAADGTSAATPFVASLVALLNNERFNRNMTALGFLNPLLYKFGKFGFTDITRGRSVGCQGTSFWGLPSPVVPNAGWSAVKGWDPVTGWGTPLYDRLRKLAILDWGFLASAKPQGCAIED